MTRTSWRVALAVMLALSAARTAAAQSLADVARNEEARRMQTAPARTYTNADLNVGTAPKEEPPAGEPDTSIAQPEKNRRSVTIVENQETGQVNISTPAEDQKPDEAQWRRTARDLRGRLAKAQSDAAAAESELAALVPGQAQDTRQSTTAALTRRRNDVRLLSEELTRFILRAQTSKIPSDWIR